MAYWWEIGRSSGALVHEFHRYWTRKLNGRAMPARADIDPAEIKPLLPNLVITDITVAPFRVQYRLLGTKVVAESGGDFTGRYLDEMVAADVENQWETCFRLVFGEKRPVYGETTVPTADGGSFTYEFGIFPLSVDGMSVAQTIGVEDYGALNDRLFELQDKAQPWRPRGVTPRKDEPKG